MEKSKELETAIYAAKKAGKILLRMLENPRIVEFKDRQDICTTADLESEKAIIEVIEERFPAHGIVSEEAGEIKKSRGLCWYFDPLDGTKNFVRNIPMFSVSVSLADEKEIIAGAVFDPSTNRLYFAEKGKGAFLNGKKISVSKTADIEDGFAYIDSLEKKFHPVSKKFYRIRDFGVGSLALCYLAQGGFDVYIQDSFALQDHGAGALVAREAGAVITDLKGREFSPQAKDIIAANPLLHKKIVQLIKTD